MKLTMKNIGVVRDAEIELDGITVLAGFNGTGKSTVGKALYSVTASYANLSRRIAEERANSIKNIIVDFIGQSYFEQHYFIQSDKKADFHSKEAESRRQVLTKLSDDIVNKVRPLPEQYEEWVDLFPWALKDKSSSIECEIFPRFLEKMRNAVNRPIAEYVQYLVEMMTVSAFAGQINTIGFSIPGEIALTAGQEKQVAWMKIAGNKVVECSSHEVPVSRPIYLSTNHVLDYFDLLEDTVYIAELDEILFNKPQNGQTFEEYKSRQHVLDLIASVIHGKLIVSSEGLFSYGAEYFSTPISIWNIASGNKTFAVLQRLIENGALRANTVLIIDEPENNQHPAWQLKLAETLVLLHKELGVRLFLNTHSTYFLRAIEVYSDRYELSNHCHYYQTQPVDGTENLFFVRNVDGQTKLIYHDFYMPFEEL